MASSNRWADILRVIGRALDVDRADSVTIRGGDGLRVDWHQEGVARGSSYGQLDMEALRMQAPLMRRAISQPDKGTARRRVAR